MADRRSPSLAAALGRAGAVAPALRRQHLAAASAADEAPVVLDDLLGLHATVAASPYLQLRARMPAFAPGQLDALLDTGRAARLACMRRTLFVVSAELAPVVLAATRELALRDHDRFLAANGLTPRRYEELAARVERALAGRALDAAELRAAVGADAPLSPVLVVMCDTARLVRWRGAGRPRYRRFEEALPDIRLDGWDEQAAIRALVDRYVRRYGPVRERDVAWWTGLRTTTVRAALASLPGLLRVAVDGLDGVFLLHEDDLAEAQGAASPAGEVSLLPVLDPYLQGYRDRERALDSRRRPYVVDRGGNTTSVVLVDGRVAGVWDLVRKPAPELRLLLFERLDAATRRAVRTLAGEVAELVLAAPAPVVERDGMRPLAEQGAGGFLSPLKDGP